MTRRRCRDHSEKQVPRIFRDHQSNFIATEQQLIFFTGKISLKTSSCQRQTGVVVGFIQCERRRAGELDPFFCKAIFPLPKRSKESLAERSTPSGTNTGATRESVAQAGTTCCKPRRRCSADVTRSE